MLRTIFTGTIICLFSIVSVKAQLVYAPKLSCVTNGQDVNGDDYVRLIWTVPVNTCGPFNAYYIYRASSFNGPYGLVYTETNQAATSYDDYGATGTVYYFMVSDFNCPGGTFLHSDTVDNLDPVAPEINYVTVVNNGAVINWNPGASPETYGYIIYHVQGGSNNPFDTIYGKNNTTYVDAAAAVNTDSVSYSLVSIDSCLNTGPFNQKTQHSIFLTKSVNRCSRTISLTWYPYDHWQPGVLQYDVYASTNGSPYVLEQTLPATTLSYNLTGFNDGDSICVNVVAVQTTTSYTSTSNTLCEKFNVVQPANDLYIRNVTVSAPDHVDVYYSMDSLADLVSLRIERSLDSVLFSPLAAINIPGDLSVTNIFSDTTANTGDLSYFYRIIAVDSCNGQDTSSIAKSILLSGYAFSDLSFLLNWDEAFIEHGTITGYDLYRDDGSGFNKISSFPETNFEYEENNLPTSVPCYYVEGIATVIFPSGAIDTARSRSNVLCLNQPSQIYMPNAFAPQGKNNIFKPILNVEGVASFTFSVFNRWGREIFTTNDENKGWDGKYNGTYVQEGAYAYQVVVVDDNKKHVEARGTVLVVR